MPMLRGFLVLIWMGQRMVGADSSTENTRMAIPGVIKSGSIWTRGDNPQGHGKRALFQTANFLFNGFSAKKLAPSFCPFVSPYGNVPRSHGSESPNPIRCADTKSYTSSTACRNGSRFVLCDGKKVASRCLRLYSVKA